MENFIIQIFSILIQAIVELYIIISLSKRLSNVEKYEKKQIIFMFIAIFIILIISYVLNYFNLRWLKMLSFPLIEILAMKFILKQNFKYSLIIEIICMALFAISETLCVAIFMSIFKDKIFYSYFLNISNIVFINVFVAIITLLINKFINIKNYLNININLNNISSKNIIFLLISILIYIIPQMLIFILAKYEYPIYFLLINCAQFVIINIFTFFFLKKDMAYQKSRSDLITSEVHNKTLIGMIDGVRTLKHDYNNIIQALNGYIVTKQYDKLEEHIKSLLKECNGINNISSIDPKVFNDPAIYGIVGSKYFLANERGIPFEFDITTNIAELEFPKPELSRIMGILLDNAIEATTKCDNPYIRLQIRFDNRKCADLIKIYNTYDKSINIDLEKIFKKGYSSKEVKSGIGLWEVKKLVKQNSNSQIYASIEGEMFVQNIVIER